MLGGLAFSLGLILVVVAGAELFTGNHLIAMAWASGDVSTAKVIGGNLVGGSLLVAIFYWVIYLRPVPARRP